MLTDVPAVLEPVSTNLKRRLARRTDFELHWLLKYRQLVATTKEVLAVQCGLQNVWRNPPSNLLTPGVTQVVK